MVRDLLAADDRIAGDRRSFGGKRSNVLISGESGKGEQVIARAIHDHSPRVKTAFQVIDCTAIPVPLSESVLFGHVKGSFNHMLG